MPTLLENPRPRTKELLRRSSIAEGETWVIVLAGGEGSRLKELTLTAEGHDVPKQFCTFRPGHTLLSATLARAHRFASPDHVLVLVTESQRTWWAPELAQLPEENVLAQPRNRGTAVAILHALVRVLVRDRAPMILLLPSDQDVESEAVFAVAVQQAIDEARRGPDYPVLLGITPEHADTEYGWIVAATPNGSPVRPVLSFIEKPTLAMASRLFQWSALWNSLVIASTGNALLRLYEDAQPMLLEMYFQGLAHTHDKVDSVARLYRLMPDRDFARDLLEREPSRLRVLPVPPCGWTDLGTPLRVSTWLERHPESPLWARRRRVSSAD